MNVNNCLRLAWNRYNSLIFVRDKVPLYANRACDPGGRYWEYYSGALSWGSVTAFHSAIGFSSFNLRMPDFRISWKDLRASSKGTMIVAPARVSKSHRVSRLFLNDLHCLILQIHLDTNEVFTHSEKKNKHVLYRWDIEFDVCQPPVRLTHCGPVTPRGDIGVAPGVGGGGVGGTHYICSAISPLFQVSWKFV